MYQSFTTIIVPAVVVFITTFYATKFLISYLFGAGIIAEDMNKAKPVKLPSSGGLGVAFGIIFGILLYIFGGTFVFVPVLSVSVLLAVGLSIALIALVGFVDDINVKREKVMSTDIMLLNKGLEQWQKPLLTLVGALPLVAISAGTSIVSLPFLGHVNFGILYPLLIVPLAIIFLPNAVNLLGGFDGLQPGMIMVVSAGLLIYSLVFGTYMGAFLSAMILAAVVAFYWFNKYPAKIIPGDSFTYATGGALAAAIIVGNMESIGLVMVFPWIIEFFLHLRRKFRVRDLGVRQKDGTLKAPYGKKIYSLTHLVMNLKKKCRETDVTNYLMALEVLFVLLGFGLKLTGVL